MPKGTSGPRNGPPTTGNPNGNGRDFCGLCGSQAERATFSVSVEAEVFEEEHIEGAVPYEWDFDGEDVIESDDDNEFLSTGRKLSMIIEMKLCQACRESDNWSLNVDVERW